VTRQARERIVMPDGREVVQTDRPRADLLRYPHLGDEVTVLVRRTHDEALARRLAEDRWREHADPRPLGPSRRGWWSTTPSRASTRIDRRAAVDEQGRIVEWLDPARLGHAAGAGVEFRAARTDDERTRENTR